jgi:beta-1,4-mannosyltransferase
MQKLTILKLFERTFGSDNLFTQKKNGQVVLHEDRPALVISSTSWTPDEDFEVLLKAILVIDEHYVKSNSKQKISFVITGKGPQLEMYKEKFKTLNLQHCTITTKFLPAEDYPRLLASGDIGVCLHYSSSGLDLPMKIVDMFGSCLPVCAIDYKTLPELVKNGHNGLIFADYKELAAQLLDLLQDFPDKKRLKDMQEHLKSNFMQHRWDDEWNNVRPLFTDGKGGKVIWPWVAICFLVVGFVAVRFVLT